MYIRGIYLWKPAYVLVCMFFISPDHIGFWGLYLQLRKTQENGKAFFPQVLRCPIGSRYCLWSSPPSFFGRRHPGVWTSSWQNSSRTWLDTACTRNYQGGRCCQWYTELPKGGHWALCWVLPTGWNNNVVGICWHILYNLSKMLERHVPFCFQALWWAVALQRFATFQQFLWCKEYPLLEGAVYMEMSGQCRVLSQTATVPSMSFGALFFPENGWLLFFLWTKTNGEYYIHFDNIHLGHFV